ncbi:hypothetical protein Angca_001382, partial [Angiostrongylus cantonensis]
VSWPSVQKRYENMVTGVDKRDQDLMNKYKFCGLHFTEPTLNSKVVKNLTCRRSITKGLNQPVFYGIHYDNNSNVLMVGLNENARLYSKEELKKAAEACQASTSPNAAESVYGRPFKPNPSSVVIPRSRWHPQNTLLHGRNIWSPVSNVNDGQNSGKNNLQLYVATFPLGDDSSTESASEAPKNEIGVYTTDEEKDVRESNREEGDDARVQHVASASHHTTKMNELYDRGRNAGFQRNQNASLRESTLSSEEMVSLRMIRDFAYVYRNPTTHGFRTLENVVNLLPRKNVDYWIPLVQSHLQEVEIGAFHNT